MTENPQYPGLFLSNNQFNEIFNHVGWAAKKGRKNTTVVVHTDRQYPGKLSRLRGMLINRGVSSVAVSTRRKPGPVWADRRWELRIALSWL